MLYIIIFIFGLAIGSFLNVVIYRLETKESILISRSYCPKCKKFLKWYDLIPILSFVLSLGKCRYCGKKISWQYILVEISTACIFLLIFNFKFLIFNEFLILNFLNLFYWWLIASFLIVIFVYDLKHYLIPDKIVFPAIIISLIYLIYFQSFDTAWAGLVASGFFLSLVLISKGKWMGLGDVKLAFLMGLILGWSGVLVALFLSFFSGAVIGLILIALKKKGLKSEIPFGPFLVGSTLVAMFYSQQLINWYQGLFFL